MNEAIVERVGKALKEEGRFGQALAQSGHLYLTDFEASVLAGAAIAAYETALADAGMVIVPREPTAAMIAAGGEVIPRRDGYAAVWHAMVLARKGRA